MLRPKKICVILFNNRIVLIVGKRNKIMRQIFLRHVEKIGKKGAEILNSEPHLSLVPFIGFIVGILIYFGLPAEPDIRIAVGMTLFSFILCLIPCTRLKKILCCITPFFITLGFLLVVGRAHFVQTRFIPHAVLNVQVSGFVVETQSRIDRSIVVIVPTEIYQTDKITGERKSVFLPQELPTKIRLTIYRDNLFVKKGDYLTGTVFKLTRPAPAMTPYSSSQAAAYWFEGIGAIGSMRSVYINHHISQSGYNSFEQWLDSIRTRIHQIFQKTFSPENAGIAEALVLGETNFVTQSSRQLYRVLGLSHILAVSGFHIGLVAFLVYGLIRFVFVFLPSVFPMMFIKRLAVISALLAAGFYTVLSGSHAPAVRSFIMIFFILTAVFFDKRALSVRTVFLAAFLMLCIAPHLILSVSFQLSFAAVLCLTGIVDVFQKHIRMKLESRTAKIVGGFGIYILFNLSVTLITLPFVAYYFHQFQPYSILGNILFGTLYACLIIPFLFGAVLLIATPIGEGLCLVIDYLLCFINWVGMPIALAPHATVIIPYFYTYGLVLWGIGLMGMALFRSRIRWIFAGMMLSIIVSFLGVEKPIAMIGAGGNYVAVRKTDGQITATESYYYPQWHTAFLLFDRQSAQTVIPKRIYRDVLQIDSFRIGQSVQQCERSLFNIRRRGMEQCPRLITPEEMLDLHTILVYQNGKNFYLFIAGKQEKDRLWGKQIPDIFLSSG